MTPVNPFDDGPRHEWSQHLSLHAKREVLFETARLQLVRATATDIPLFVAVYCSKEMMAHLGRPFSEDQAAARIEVWDQQWKNLGWGGGVIFNKETSLPIGTAKLIPTKLPEYLGSYEVGYMILPQHQGNGYASEIAAGAVRCFFERLLAQSVVADVHPDNGPSSRVLEKLGFIDRGVTNFSHPDFAGYDRQRVWLLPREKWEAGNK